MSICARDRFSPEAHPEIEIISRDRFVNYKEAATQGAPGAIQVADRFHLVKNLHDALRRMLDRHTADLRRAAELVTEQPSVMSTPNPTPSEPKQVQTDSVPTAPAATVTPVATDAGESALLAERFAAPSAAISYIQNCRSLPSPPKHLFAVALSGLPVAPPAGGVYDGRPIASGTHGLGLQG